MIYQGPHGVDFSITTFDVCCIYLPFIVDLINVVELVRNEFGGYWQVFYCLGELPLQWLDWDEMVRGCLIGLLVKGMTGPLP